MSQPPEVSQHVATTQQPPTVAGGETTARKARVRAVGRDREHHLPARAHRLKLRLSPDELADVEAAARASGLTPTGYAAEVAIAVARQTPTPRTEPLRAALADLVDVRAQLRRLTTNVHLAVSAMHHSGEVPDWLVAAVTDATRAVARVDAAASTIAEELR